MGFTEPGSGLPGPGSGLLEPSLGSTGPGSGLPGPGLGLPGPGLGFPGPGLGLPGPGSGLGGGMEGWMDGWTDRDLEKIALCGIIGHRPLPGRCPKVRSCDFYVPSGLLVLEKTIFATRLQFLGPTQRPPLADSVFGPKTAIFLPRTVISNTKADISIIQEKNRQHAD